MAYSEIGEMVRALRDVAGLSLRDVEKRSGVHRGVLSGIESGGRPLAPVAVQLGPVLGEAIFEIADREADLQLREGEFHTSLRRAILELKVAARPVVGGWNVDSPEVRAELSADWMRRFIAIDWDAALCVEKVIDAMLEGSNLDLAVFAPDEWPALKAAQFSPAERQEIEVEVEAAREIEKARQQTLREATS